MAIARILTNEGYIGTLIQGRFTTPNYKVKKTVVKSNEEWIRIYDAYEAIISLEEFDTVQRLLGRDTRVAPNRNEVYLLSGIAVCGDCGRQMSRKVSTVSGKKYAYYMCSANKKDGTCSSHRIREEELEMAVMKYLARYAEDLTELKEILDFIDQLPMQGTDTKRLDLRILQLEEEVQRYGQLKVSVYEDLKDGLISKDEYVSMKQEFELRRRNALDSMEQTRLERERMEQTDGKHHSWIEGFVKNNGIQELIRNVVAELIDQISVYEGKRIEVKFRYADKYLETVQLVKELQDELPIESRKLVGEVS